MKMIRKIEQPEAKFDLYFMGYDSPKALSHGNHFSDREGLIELTHNYGTENDPEYKVTTGNAEPYKYVCPEVMSMWIGNFGHRSLEGTE